MKIKQLWHAIWKLSIKFIGWKGILLSQKICSHFLRIIDKFLKIYRTPHTLSKFLNFRVIIDHNKQEHLSKHVDLSNLTSSRQNSLLRQPMIIWCPSCTYLYSQKLVPCGQILRRWCWPPPGALWHREEFGKARSNQLGTWSASRPTAPVPNSFPKYKGSEEECPEDQWQLPSRIKKGSQSRKCCFTEPVKACPQFTMDV